MIRVGVVDDHPLFREGVIHTLSARGDFEVVGAGMSAEDAVRIACEERPDIVILDMDMPGGGGIQAIELLAEICPEVKTLILTVVADEERVCEAIRKGAKGYVLKGIGGGELARIVHLIHEGQSYVTPTLATYLLSYLSGAAEPAELNPFASLSLREEQILGCIARGLSNKEIARELDIREKTVKHYVTSLLQKLRVRNRVEAAILASKAPEAGAPAIRRRTESPLIA